MTYFYGAITLALVVRTFLGNFDFSARDVLMTLFIGTLVITPAVYSVFAGKVYIAGGVHTAKDSPFVFYPLQCFSAFVGGLIVLLPINIGLFDLGLRQI